MRGRKKNKKEIDKLNNLQLMKLIDDKCKKFDKKQEKI